MIPVRTMKHIPQMREIPHLNPQRLGNLHETIAPLDKARETAINILKRSRSLQQLTIASVDRAREMAINGWASDFYLYSQSQALLTETSAAKL